MDGTLGANDWRRMRVLLANHRKQLWDASRQLDMVCKTFPSAQTRRAKKDVSAALHSAYMVYEFVKEQVDALPEASDRP